MRVVDRRLFLVWMGIAIPFLCAPSSETSDERCPYGAVHLDEADAREFFAELASQSSIWWQTTADEAYWQLSTFLGGRGIPNAVMVMRASADPLEGVATLKPEWDYRYMRLQRFAPSIYPEMAREANESLLPRVESLCREWQIAKDAPLEAIRLGLVDEMERTRRAAAVGDPQRKHLDLDVDLPSPSFP